MSDFLSELRFTPGGEGRNNLSLIGKRGLQEKLSQAAAPFPLADRALFSDTHILYNQARLKSKLINPKPSVTVTIQKNAPAPRKDILVKAFVRSVPATKNVTNGGALQKEFNELNAMRARMIERMKKLGFSIANNQKSDAPVYETEPPLSLNRKKIFIMMADMRMMIKDYEQVKNFDPSEAEDFLSVQKNYFDRIRKSMDQDFTDIQKNCAALSPKKEEAATLLSRIHAHKALIASGEEYLKKISDHG